MDIKEFKRKYGTTGWQLPIEEFIRRAPEFKGDEELARLIGGIAADLKSVLEEVRALVAQEEVCGESEPVSGARCGLTKGHEYSHVAYVGSAGTMKYVWR